MRNQVGAAPILARLFTVTTGLEHVESLTIDYEQGLLEIRTVDGRVVRQRGGAALPSRPNGPLDFKRVTFRPADLVMTTVTTWDLEFEAEVFANDDQLARRSGRPVIYLDQNKWIQVLQAIHRPERVHGSDLAPTLRLIHLAQAKQVILPISSGHWIETAKVYGERRSHLAAAMVGLSRGWLMCDPLLVRACEMRALFTKPSDATGTSIREPVFTLDPHQLYAEPSPTYIPRGPGLPSEWVDLISALSGAQAVLGVLLENERTQSSEGLKAAASWAAVHQRFATHLATEAATRPHLRALTLYRFLADLGHGPLQAAHEAGLSPSDYVRWLRSRADADIAQLPYLGRKREVIHLRLLNPQSAWKPNDLVDTLFLPCAAGYADYVVCENQAGDYLQRVARNHLDGATVFTSIRDLVAALGA